MPKRGTTPSRLARRRRTIGHGRSSPRAEKVLGASEQPKNKTTKGGRAHHAGHLIEELDQPGATGKPPNTNRRGRATGAAQSSHLYQLSPEPNLPRQRLQEDDGAQHINAAQSEDLGFHPGDGSGGQPGPQQRLHGGSRRPKASTSLGWASQPRVSPGLELPPGHPNGRSRG